MKKLFINRQDQAVQALSMADPVMQKLVAAVGDIEITLRSNYFTSLVRSIIGQQISVTAATAIYNRLELLLDNKITADSLLKVTDEQLREVGLTYRKIEYVQDLAVKMHHSKINLQNLAKLDKKTIITQLTSVKGIGKWTAEMFLILSLGRMDVLAIDDIGIQRAAKWLYQVDKSKRRDILKEKAPLWSPHLSIASFYLWEAVHLDFVIQYASVDAIEK